MNSIKYLWTKKGRKSTYRTWILIIFTSILVSGVIYSVTEKVWNSVSHDITNFPLIGKHKTISCSECHKKGGLSGTPTSCEGCHLYRKKDDVHNLQLGVHCGECHTPVDWKLTIPGSWSHVRDTGFELKGQHRVTDCRQCHEDNVYARVDRACSSCHMDDYKRAKSPDHISLGYSTECENCHNNSLSWKGAVLDHNLFWPLRGPHLGHDCTVCHSGGYNITSDCIQCHLDDYQNATDPNHVQAGFSTDCTLCHLAESYFWSQASFDHRFPIYEGDHRTLLCTDCHLTANYYEFNCIDCHQHNRDEMDREHSGVGGYEYSSVSCYFCHPDGN